MRIPLIAGLLALFAFGAEAAGPDVGPDPGPGQSQSGHVRPPAGPHGGGSHGGGRPGRGPGGGGRPPHQVPEIDAVSGLGALAVLGASGALVWERRRRRM